MDQFDAFSVFFWDNNVHVGGHTYLLGQATVDVLNLSAGDFDRLCDCAEAFDRALGRMIDRRDRRMAEEVQAKFNAAYNVILTLPVFRDLELDAGAHSVFTDLHDMPEAWDETMHEDTAGGQLLRSFAARVSCLPERLNNFRGQVALMLEYFFEDLSRRSSAEYGRAFDDYWRAMATDGAKLYPFQAFEQSFPAELSFVPMRHPDQPDEYLVAERAKFAELHFLLYTDFYRALAHGNAPLSQLRTVLSPDARLQHLLLQQHRAGRDDANLPQGRRAHEGAPRARGRVAGTAGVQPRVWASEDAAQTPPPMPHRARAPHRFARPRCLP